jgi:hypothetical protein
MKFLHWEIDAGPDNVIAVRLNRQANVRLLDDINFSAYRSGQSHRYRGGLAKRSPATLGPPHSGRWHVVVDLGGYAGSLEAAVSII